MFILICESQIPSPLCTYNYRCTYLLKVEVKLSRRQKADYIIGENVLTEPNDMYSGKGIEDMCK